MANVLGYSNTQEAVRRHCKRPQPVGVHVSRTLNQQTTIIPESDVYRLIMRSKLPGAIAFEEWVTEEVLPTIRKTGGVYMTLEKAEEILFNPDLMIDLAQQVKQLRAENTSKQEQIEADRPKVNFADAVAVSHTSILVGELAKLLKQNDVSIGQNRLFEILREEGYLIKRKGTDFNMPTQKSMELGLFEIKERTLNDPASGAVRITKTTKVTGKGQIYFINRYCEKAAYEQVN